MQLKSQHYAALASLTMRRVALIMHFILNAECIRVSLLTRRAITQKEQHKNTNLTNRQNQEHLQQKKVQLVFS